MTHRLFRAVACGLVVVVGAGGLLAFLACGHADPSQETPRAPEAPATPQSRQLHFDPAKSDHLDVAVGETLVSKVGLVADGAVDWDDVRILSTCECLSGEFISEAVAGRAEIQLTIFGLEQEDIDGALLAENGKREQLAEHVARIAIRRLPFVAPRELTLRPTPSADFELVVGQAFKPDSKLPDSILVNFDTATLDATKIVLADYANEPVEHREKDWILRTKLTFTVTAADRSLPFETTIPVEFGEPPVKRVVKVHWLGGH